MQALRVLKIARLEAMGRRGRGGYRAGAAVTGAWTAARDNAIRTALKEMRPNVNARSTPAAQPSALAPGRR
jgi:hypothetical protein